MNDNVPGPHGLGDFRFWQTICVIAFWAVIFIWVFP